MASNFESIPEGVAVPIIAGLGIFGNITCLLVLSNKSVDLKPSFSNLLKCLAVYDILILVNTIFIGPRKRSERGPTKPLLIPTGATKLPQKTITFERRA